MSNIITEKQAKLERYLAYDFATPTRETYMAYYLYILKVACESELISKDVMELINKVFVNTIIKGARGKSVIVSNVVYAVSYYLQMIGPQRAYEELSVVVSNTAAENFLNTVKIFVQKYITQNLTILHSVERIVAGFDNDSISSTYEILESYLIDIKEYDISEDINFQELHGCTFKVMSYGVDYDVQAYENYFDILENYVKKFSVELKIMKKLNGQSFFKNMSVRAKEIEDARMVDDPSVEIAVKYEGMLKELNDKEAKELLALNSKIVSNISENQYYSILSEIESTKTKYQELRANLESQWEEEDDEVEKTDTSADITSEELFFAQSIAPSFKEMVKSVAVGIMIKMGIIEAESYADAIWEVSFDEAVETVLGFKEKFNFTECEIEYLTTRR